MRSNIWDSKFRGRAKRVRQLMNSASPAKWRLVTKCRDRYGLSLYIYDNKRSSQGRRAPHNHTCPPASDLLPRWTFFTAVVRFRFLKGHITVVISIRLAKLFLEKPALASIGLCFIERQAPIFVQVGGVEGGFTPICPGDVPLFPSEFSVMIEVATGKNLFHEVIAGFGRAKFSIVIRIRFGKTFVSRRTLGGLAGVENGD